MKKYLIPSLALCSFGMQAFKIDRVIVATNSNPLYAQFWPIVARFWKDVVGVQPTLAFIEDGPADLDETLGDVVRFKPIPGVSPGVQAQAMRLLLPTLFPEEGCILSDIDMIPLQKEYFTELVKDAPQDAFIVYRPTAYAPSYKRYPMCYVAAQGKTFKEIFNEHDRPFHELINEWIGYRWGFCTDELVMHKLLHAWPQFEKKCIKLAHEMHPQQRIDRSDWRYDKKLLKKRWYIDSHMVRPYHQYKQEIDQLVSDFYA